MATFNLRSRSVYKGRKHRGTEYNCRKPFRSSNSRIRISTVDLSLCLPRRSQLTTRSSASRDTPWGATRKFNQCTQITTFDDKRLGAITRYGSECMAVGSSGVNGCPPGRRQRESPAALPKGFIAGRALSRNTTKSRWLRTGSNGTQTE